MEAYKRTIHVDLVSNLFRNRLRILITLSDGTVLRCWRRDARSIPRRPSLHEIEDRGNKEYADEGFRYHASDHRRSHDLACYRARSGSGPERHAAENKGERGHHERPEAKPRRGKCSISDGHTALVVLLGKRDDQNRVFRSQTDEHHQANLGVHIVLHLNHVRRLKEAEHDATQPERGESAEYCDPRAEQDAKRHCPAFIEGCQDQKNEQNRKSENDRRRYSLSRLLLLVRHSDVVEAHFAWHRLLENILQCRGCLIGAVTGRSARIALRGPVLVVAPGELGAGTSLEFCQRGKRDRLPLAVAHIELPKIVSRRPVRRLSLHIHLPGTAEVVVVVNE